MRFLPAFATVGHRGFLTFLALLTWVKALAADPVTYYSNTGAAPAVTTSCVTIFCTDVTNPNRATDALLTNFATLSLGTIIGSASISMKLSATAPAYSRAGVVVSGTTALTSLNLLGGARLTTYDKGVEKDQLVVDTNLLKAAIGSDRPTRLEFQASYAFDEVKLEYYQTVSISLLNKHDLRVYYAFSSSNSNQDVVNGYLSRTNDHSTAVSPGAIGVCVNTAVANPEWATDTDLTTIYTCIMLCIRY